MRKVTSGFGPVLVAIAALGCSGNSGGPEDMKGSVDSADAVETGSPDAVQIKEEPVYWSAAATRVVDDLVFVYVDGKPFFSLGFDVQSSPIYDGVAGPKECDPATGKGYVDYQVEKSQSAAAAGANLAFVWGYGNKAESIVATSPGLHGTFHSGWGTTPTPEHDIVPVFYNGFGEEDMDSDPAEKVPEMKAAFEEWKSRTGRFSPAAMPNLPPYEDLPWMAWHPTSRMIADPTLDKLWEMHTEEVATAFARTTNMMIGDFYTYRVNRFDPDDPMEAIMAAATGQIGPKGEGYDDWLASDDPPHRPFFSAAWDLTNSLIEKRTEGSVVWLWIQGFAPGDSVNQCMCEGGSCDQCCLGPFPPRRYLRKEISSVIAAGGTGTIFFGWFAARWPEVEEMNSVFRALSHPEVYEPVLTSPRLDLGVDTRHLGEPGHDGQGRAHAMVKWHEPSRKAFVVFANPGAQATTVELPFPWSIAKVERLDWDAPVFVGAPEVELKGTTLATTIPIDEGVIYRVTPLEK
jgi:hypothetical protein